MNLSLKNQKHGTHLSGAIPKTLKIVLASVFILCLGSFPAEAQIFKNLGKKVEKAVERGVEKTVERKAQGKAEEKTGEVLDGVLGNKKKRNSSSDANDGTGINTSQDPSADVEGFEGAVKGAMKSGSLHTNSGSDLNCPIMEVNEVYVGAATPATRRKVTMQEDNTCGYEIEIYGGLVPLTITAQKMSSSDMKKELSAYRQESGGMLSVHSTTSGNVNYGIHKQNRWLIVFDITDEYIYKFDFDNVRYAQFANGKTMVDFEKAKKVIINIANHFVKNKK